MFYFKSESLKLKKSYTKFMKRDRKSRETTYFNVDKSKYTKQK